MFLGEYLWSPAWKHYDNSYYENDGWVQPEHGCPVSIRVSSFEYHQESAGFDLKMRTAIQTIEVVIQSGLLDPDLSTIPKAAATETEIRDEEALLGKPLSEEYKEILRRWNGLDLDVVRINGCGQTSRGIERLSKGQLREEINGVAIGSDPAGFVYVQRADGSILSLDTDGGDDRQVANNLADFLGRLVFGADAGLFCGAEWEAEVRAKGLI